MVYLAGDNNLSEDMITCLKGMMNFGTQEKINLVALYDGGYPASDIKFFNFTKESPDRSLNGHRRTLEHFEEILETPKKGVRQEHSKIDLFELKEFIPRVMEKFPAEKYALIISAHSDGVIGRTTLRDDNPNISLNLVGLRRVLEKGLEDEYGEIRKLDLLGFDSCLMGMLEVGFELKDIAKVMVASEGNIPTTGWAYEEVLADLMEKGGGIDEKEFAVSIVDRYADFSVDYTLGGRSVNISACNLEELYNENSIYTLIQELGKIFNDIFDLPTEISETVNEQRAQENQLIKDKFVDWMLLAHHRSQLFMHNQAVDIIDFLSNFLVQYPKWLRENEILGLIPKTYEGGEKQNTTIDRVERRITEIFNKFKAIENAINESSRKYILASSSVGAEYQFSKGMSLFFPWTILALNLISDRYNELKFNENKNWLDFISNYTSYTFRKNNIEPLIQEQPESLFSLSFDALRHKEVGRKEVGRKEVGKKGSIEEFYLYFSQFQNYDPEVFKKHRVASAISK